MDLSTGFKTPIAITTDYNDTFPASGKTMTHLSKGGIGMMLVLVGVRDMAISIKLSLKD